MAFIHSVKCVPSYREYDPYSGYFGKRLLHEDDRIATRTPYSQVD